MSVDLDRMTYEELLDLNHRVVARLKMLDSMQAHHEMMSFHLGARVSFESQQGRMIGKVVKFNRKTVTVITEEGRRWNVSPHLLSPVTDIDVHDADEQPSHKRLK